MRHIAARTKWGWFSTNIRGRPNLQHTIPSIPDLTKSQLLRSNQTSQLASSDNKESTMSSSPFAVQSIDHVVLTVASIQATVEFYTQHLGMTHETFVSGDGVER